MTARRMLLGTAGGPFAPPVAIGSRATIASSGYNAFPGQALVGTDRHLIYRFGSAHNSAAGEADARVSTDGVTWPGGGTIIVSTTGSDDIRDPNILRLSTGRILYTYDHENPYTPGSGVITAHVRYSDDGGATRSAEYTLAQLGGTYFKSIVSSPPIELAGGDVILPGFAVVSGTGDPVGGYWRSTDHGATFGSFVTIASGVRDYQETQIRVLASGRWVALHRVEANHHTWRHHSDDAGATWSTPTDVSAMTGRPDFVEIRPGRLIQFGRYNTSADSPGYYAVSADDGVTWTTPQELDPGSTELWMYGAPLVNGTGTIELVYCLESNGSTSGIYRRVVTG